MNMSSAERACIELVLASPFEAIGTTSKWTSHSPTASRDLGDILFYVLCRRPTELIAWENLLSGEETISTIAHYTHLHYELLNERAGAFAIEGISVAESLWSIFGNGILIFYEHALRTVNQRNQRTRDLIFDALAHDAIPTQTRVQIGAMAIHYSQMSAEDVAQSLNGGYRAKDAAEGDIILNPQSSSSEALRELLANYDLRNFDLKDVHLTGNLYQDAEHLRIIAAQKLYQTGRLDWSKLENAKLNNALRLAVLEQYASAMPEAALELALKEGRDTGWWPVAYQVMRTWLNSNMLEASRHIEELPPTPERDRISAYVAKESASYGDYEAALEWLKYIASDDIHRETSHYISEMIKKSNGADRQ